MRTAAALLFLAGTAACGHKQDEQPVGRYQMVATGNERHEVFVLDTKDGTIWSCADFPQQPLTIGCGVPHGRPK